MKNYNASAMKRFNESFYVNYQTGCWEWTKAIRNKKFGYGVFWYNGKNVYAHRAALLLHKNIPLKTNKCADHLCRNRKCVNPSHLEMVSFRENILRGESLPSRNAKKQFCPRGHELSGENLYLHKSKSGCLRRHCRSCRELNDLKRRTYTGG